MGLFLYHNSIIDMGFIISYSKYVGRSKLVWSKCNFVCLSIRVTSKEETPKMYKMETPYNFEKGIFSKRKKLEKGGKKKSSLICSLLNTF